jgi:type IV pilus assembly protein PilN
MIKINLLKPEKKEVAGGGAAVSYSDETTPSKLNTPALIGAIAITLVGVGLLYFLQSSQLAHEKKLLVEQTLKKAELEKVLMNLAEIEATKKELDNKIKIIGDLKMRQKDAVFMMYKMSACLPEWVWLTDLSFNGGTVTITGKALSNNLIADLMNNLENSNSFTNVQLASSVRQRESGNDVFIFRIDCSFVRQPELNKVG